MHLHEILDIELARFDGYPLRVIETGTIRGSTERSRIGDGWSTEYFARRQAQYPAGKFVSIDLDTTVADQVLTSLGLRDSAILIRDHSISALATLAIKSFTGRDLGSTDVIFLDSDNDAMLIFHEFLIAFAMVHGPPVGLIIVDDIAINDSSKDAHKGDLVVPYVRDHGLKHHIVTRAGCAGYQPGVLVVEC